MAVDATHASRSRSSFSRFTTDKGAFFDGELIFFDARAVDILRMVDEEEYGVVWARYNGENSGASDAI